MRRTAGLLAVGVLIAGCGADPDAGPGPATVTASPGPGTAGVARAPEVVATVASGLEVPWGLAFLPDGRAVVTERDSGRVLLVDPDGGDPVVAGTVGETSPGGEAGLLGVAVSPDFDADDTVYLYVSTASDNRVVRASLEGDVLGPREVVLGGIPRGPIHDGGRLAFGPDGRLYVATGETGVGELSQDPDSLAGKILRITTEGEPAPGNPDPGSPVWSLGHRNVQGLAFDDDGRLWASEFGQNTYDELNLVEAGANYGWPQTEGRSEEEAFTNPRVVWSTGEASPSGLAFLDGSLWMAALRGARLWRIDVDDGRATDATDFLVQDHGRLRTVVVAPDGRLWLTTSNRDGRGSPSPSDDRILVVDPG